MTELLRKGFFLGTNFLDFRQNIKGLIKLWQLLLLFFKFKVVPTIQASSMFKGSGDVSDRFSL